jgi:uroporphyrinogen decarboxylase
MGFVEMGLFERSYLLLGMEPALIAYLTEPQEMAAMLGAIADFKIDVVAGLHKHAQIDILWYGDDWGTQSNLFIPPAIWRQTIKPHTQRIYDRARALGIVVNQHSCGRIESIVGDMVEIGAEMWNPCQPCNDLAALKLEYGKRLTFCGGIDSQFVLGRPDVTAKEVRAEVRKRIDDLAGGGGYIAAPSHSVPYDPDILHAMHDEIATYGRQVYRKPRSSSPSCANRCTAPDSVSRGGIA